MSRAPVQRTFQGSPEMAHVQNLAQDFETSIEATARRIVELNEYPCAIVFSKDNVVRYTVKSKYFEEQLCVWKGDALPSKSPSRAPSTDPEAWDEIYSYWWLKELPGSNIPESIYEQTLCQ